MKTVNLIIKIVAALAAVAGLVYVIATYGDKIVAWAKKLLGYCPCDGDCECCDCECDCEDCECECCCEDEGEEEAAEESTEEAAEADEEPVAAEADFEG